MYKQAQPASNPREKFQGELLRGKAQGGQEEAAPPPTGGEGESTQESIPERSIGPMKRRNDHLNRQGRQSFSWGSRVTHSIMQDGRLHVMAQRQRQQASDNKKNRESTDLPETRLHLTPVQCVRSTKWSRTYATRLGYFILSQK